jgi:hypothetical protein
MSLRSLIPKRSKLKSIIRAFINLLGGSSTSSPLYSKIN